ncbi:hypothetical protein EC991_005472 [Linnemannia zychae]|nr:hypothetical protein EC991_005472 [Linnemannia zychae]
MTEPDLMHQLLEDGGYVTRLAHFYNGKSLAEIALDFDPLGESHFSKVLYLPQFETSRILKSALVKAGVKIEYGWELMETQVKEGQDESHASASSSWVETTVRKAIEGTNSRRNESTLLGTFDLSEEDSDKQYEYETIRSQYLIGADGARSAIRHKINMPFPGRTRDMSIIVVDGIMDTNIDTTKFSLIHSKDGRTIGILPVNKYEKNRCQLLVEAGVLTPEELLETRSNKTPTLEYVQTLVDDICGPIKLKIEKAHWLSYYRANERRGEDFVFKDRIFLTGDAAHIHSPLTGQGLNAGIQDAHNLAWKLALVVKGLASASLLRSYGEERIPIAEEVTKFTAVAFGFYFNADKRLIKRIRKRINLAFLPFWAAVLPKKTIPTSMLTLRYHENSVNKNHTAQYVSSSNPGAVGRRAPDATLTPLVASGDSGFNSNSSLDSDSLRVNPSGAEETVSKILETDSIRLYGLMARPGAFQVLVFTGDLWERHNNSKAAIQVVKTLDSHLAKWRSRWSLSDHEAIEKKLGAGKTCHLFMVHTITVLQQGWPLSTNDLKDKKFGEGKVYTDRKGKLHQSYSVNPKLKKNTPELGGAIVVVRPDSFIAYRVQGLGESAWNDVNEYFESILV